MRLPAPLRHLIKPLRGVVVTLAMLLGAELFSRYVFFLPNVASFGVIAVAVSAVVDGVRGGVLSAIIVTLYAVVVFSPGGSHSFHYDRDGMTRALVVAVSALSAAFIVGLLKHRSDDLITDRLFMVHDSRMRAAIHNLTQHKADELKAIIEQMPAGIFIGDANGFSTINRVGLKMLGFESLEDLRLAARGRAGGIRAALPEQRDPATGALIAVEDDPFVRALRDGIRSSREIAYTPADGGPEIVVVASAEPIRDETTGAVIGALCVHTDITERLRAHEARERASAALVRSEARLRRVLDSGVVGVISWDLDTGVILNANDLFLRLVGATREEVEAGRLNLRDLTPPEWIDRTEEGFEAIRAEGFTPPYEKQYLSRTGERVTVLTGGALYPDSTHEGVSFVIDIRDRKRLEAELTKALEKQRSVAEKQQRIAETLQRSLLIDAAPRLIAGIEFGALYEPAMDEALIGGDFYDAFPLAHDRAAFVIGDMTGKGLSAAAYTAEVKYALRAFLREDPDPAIALERLNRLICAAQEFDERPVSSLVCVSIAVVEARTGMATFAGGGMDYPLVLHAATGTVTAIETSGIILGVRSNGDFKTTQVPLESGDLLVMATDGITEARQHDKIVLLFGYDGLMRAAVEAAGALSDTSDLGEIGARIVEEARSFAGGLLQDDACLLLARRP